MKCNLIVVAAGFLTAVQFSSPAFGLNLPAGVNAEYELTVVDQQTGMAMFGGPNDPIEFYIDPSLPRWQKEIEVPIGPDGLHPGARIGVWEYLRVLPPPQTTTMSGLPWTDWHEVVGPANATGGHLWGWADTVTDTITGQIGPPELVIHNLPGGPLHVPGMLGSPIVANGPSVDIWFEWPGAQVSPQLHGPLDVWIHKELVYYGPSITNPNNDASPLRIQLLEWPTVPEPSSAALAGMGLIGVIGVALRHRRAKRSDATSAPQTH